MSQIIFGAVVLKQFTEQWFSITILIAFAFALIAFLAIKYQEHRKKP